MLKKVSDDLGYAIQRVFARVRAMTMACLHWQVCGWDTFSLQRFGKLLRLFLSMILRRSNQDEGWIILSHVGDRTEFNIKRIVQRKDAMYRFQLISASA